MVQEYSFDSGEIQLNYAEGGTPGKPVMVLIHGLTGRWQAYTADFNDYGQDWHLYAPDLRGHGKSSKPEAGYHFPNYARDIIAFLQEVVKEPVVLVGHSLGAQAALAVAHMAPACVRGLIANDPPTLGEDLVIDDYPEAQAWFKWVYEIMNIHPDFEQVFARCKASFPDAPDAGMQDMAEVVIGIAPGTVRAALENATKEGYDLQSGLRNIHCPTLLLYGDFDQGSVVRDIDADEFKRLVPQAVVRKIEGGTHMMWWERAEERQRYVLEFLSAIS